MPRLLIKSGGVPAQRFELNAGINRLGRSPANDCRLDHPAVSTSHSEIRVVEEEALKRKICFRLWALRSMDNALPPS